MKSLKADDDTPDRLSELPESLILEILSLLEMKDVVRTSLLSKQWKYLWTTIPCLRFSAFDSSVGALNFVNRALTLWRGTKLRRFSINVTNGFPASLHDDMDSWVLFAKERKVEELSIYFRNSSENFPVRPPQSLYECSCIKKLSLHNCDLRVPINLEWDRLKTLHLCGHRFTEGVIDQIVSSSPQLLMIFVRFLGSYQKLRIRFRSSSRLILWLIHSVEYDPSSKTTLNQLQIHVREERGAVVGEILLRKMLAVIQDVTLERVILSASCFKILGVRKGKYSFPSLLNVKELNIFRGNPITMEPNEMFGLLENFPNLKKLAINWKFDIMEKGGGEPSENYRDSEANNTLESFLMQLRVVQITWYSYKASIFQFIEILLKHATVIEKVVLKKRRNRVIEPEDMSMAAQKMASLQKSFPSVELILC